MSEGIERYSDRGMKRILSSGILFGRQCLAIAHNLEDLLTEKFYGIVNKVAVQYCISYRNQSLDLHCKLNGWFPYEMQHRAEIG